MLDTTLTIEQIQSRLAHIDQFNLRRNIVVPNVSWGLLNYEADFVSCSKSGYLTEVEIKRSWEDFQKDFKKDHKHDDPRVAYFFYCVPKKIRENGFEYDSKKKKYIKKRVPKEFAIILNGVRHNLIKPDVEDCKNCSLDKFCDKFKEALCDSLIGGHTGMIFEKENS